MTLKDMNDCDFSGDSKFRYFIFDDHLCLILDQRRSILNGAYLVTECISSVRGLLQLYIHEESSMIAPNCLDLWLGIQ